jgi:amidohydrolase
MKYLLDEARALFGEIVDVRRAIHREPELGLHLPLTQSRVLQSLEGLPLQVRRGKQTTSVTADLRGDGSKTIILRADMDALPLQEDVDVPFKSVIDGRMHACGHDGHVAMLCGAARILASHRNDVHGTVRFMFQPGEEGWHGARVMLEEGLLDPPDGGDAPSAAFALHMSGTRDPGTLLTRPGPVLASVDDFTIVVHGRGGHASAPHLAADPIPVACEIVTAMQTFVTRSVSVFEPGVVTVGKIEAGTTDNIIPETATLLGTVRTLSAKTRAMIVPGLRRVARGIGDAHGLAVDVEFEAGYPVTVNDPAFTRFVQEVARELVGPERAIEPPAPLMAAEDFSYVLEQIPGAATSLGTRPPDVPEERAPELHSNRYRMHEEAMLTGAAMYAAVALSYLR